jgi:hypothetical protein
MLIKVDMGEEWLIRYRENREWAIREIETRKENGAPLVDESTGEKISIPPAVVIDDSPLKGWTATVRVLPYGDLVALEREIETLADGIRAEAKAADVESAAARSASYTRRLVEVQQGFLRDTVLSLEHNGEAVSIDDLYGEAPLVYAAVKSAHHLSRERKKKLAVSEPST